MVLIIAAVLLWGSYNQGWQWTGIGPYFTPHTPKDRAFQRGKTLWDLLQLLIIPAVLAVGGYLLNSRQKQRELEIAAENRKTDQDIAEENRMADQEIAENRQQDTVLDNYLEKMSDLMLDKDLPGSDPNFPNTSLLLGEKIPNIPDS